MNTEPRYPMKRRDFLVQSGLASLVPGIDRVRASAACAAQPVILLAQEKDYFDARGAEEAFDRTATGR
jgi:hypothetical protein